MLIYIYIYVCVCVCVEASWNVVAHAQRPDFVFRRNGRVRLNRWGRQFSRILAAEVCASAVVMLDTPCSEVEWMVLATHSIRQFPLHFPSCASPCAITFQLESTNSRPSNTTRIFKFYSKLHVSAMLNHFHIAVQSSRLLNIAETCSWLWLIIMCRVDG